MSVEIIVSSEELKISLECVALISDAGPGKKKADDLKEVNGALRIKAVSPYEDKNYLLMFCRAGITEQLTYRMDGKSYKNSEPVDMCVDAKRFLALAKTFTGDVRFIFCEKELQVFVENSKYTLSAVCTVLPELTIPKGGINLSSNFLYEALRHCGVAIARDSKGAKGSVLFKIAPDGSAVCYGVNNSCVAKYVVPSTECKQELTLMLLPNAIQHIASLAENGEIRLVSTAQGIYVTTPRFDYMCHTVVGTQPDSDKMISRLQFTKSITVSKAKLLAALARASVIVGDDNNSRIKLVSDNENIYISATSIAGNGVESLALEEVSGEDEQSNWVSVWRLNRIINGCAGGSITIESGGKLKPYKIYAAGSDSFYIIAPMSA